MTKREIMIEKLVLMEREKLELAADDEIINRAGAVLNCAYCPLQGALCDKYPLKNCVDSIRTWYNEGGSNGTNN